MAAVNSAKAVVPGKTTCSSQSVSGDLPRKLVAEFIGTLFLVSTIIGSGIMAENLSPTNDGVALLGNTLATLGILFVLITVFGPVSGAHFNPVVSTAFWLKRDDTHVKCHWRLCFYFIAQFGGGILGCILAHGMFEDSSFQKAQRNVVDFEGKERTTAGEFLGEIVATVGLLITILGTIKHDEGKKQANTVPLAVGLFITAGYWFTSSTSFANPAVTVARSFTKTFAGISISSFPAYFGGQALGLLIGLPFSEWMFGKLPLASAMQILVRKKFQCSKSLVESSYADAGAKVVEREESSCGGF